MDYQHLMKEMKAMTSHNEASLLSISKLISYMQSIHITLSTSFSTLINKIKAEAKPTTATPSALSSSIYSLIEHSQANSAKATRLLDTFKTSIIDTLTLFYENQGITFKETKKNYYSIVNTLSKSKQSLDNARLFYFNAAYLARDKEKGGKDKDKLGETIYERMYHYEYITCNKKIQESNEAYAKFIQHQKHSEESKINFIKSIISEYIKLIGELRAMLSDLMDNYNELFSSSIIEQERQNVKKKLKGFVDSGDETYSSRFELEKYIGYSESLSFDLEDVRLPSNFDDIGLEPNNDAEDFSSEIIVKIQCKLYSKEEVDPELLSSLLKLLRNKPNEMSKLFLESFGDQPWYGCLNYNNLLALMTIFLFITNNFNTSPIEEYSNKGIQNINQYQELIEVNNINKRIISLTQRIYIQYDNPMQDKVYLSALMLKKNKVYQSESFWKKILIITLAEMVYSHYVLVIKNTPKEEIESKFLDNNSSSSSKLLKISIKKSSNSQLKGIINTSNIYLFIPQYDKLSKAEILSLEDYLSSEVKKEGFFKEYLNDLSSFNIPIEKIIELLTQICKELNLSTEYFSFYISYSNVCSFTIKKRIPNVKHYLEYVNPSQRTCQDKRVKLLSSTLAYLNWKDYMSLMLLDKYTNKRIEKKIYKLILSDLNIKMDIRLKIWDAILGTNALRKKYNYSSLLRKVSLNLDLKTRKEIQDDIPRTFVSPSLDKSDALDSLENILIAVAQVNEDTKYCQGMNYIAQFLLEITNDEERAFFIFLGIFKSLDYSRIFSRDHNKYKVFFYIFNRLLKLYEPEISYVFNKSGIQVYFYLAPCFYTLFQNSRQHIKEPGLPIVLLKIMDGVFTSGWKSLMKVGLNLLHEHTTKILHMKTEELNDFITLSIFSSDFFENSKKDVFDQYQMMKLPQSQLDYIDQEYSHENKLIKKIKEHS